MLKTIINEFSTVFKENSYFVIKIFLSKITNVEINKIVINNLKLSQNEIDILKTYIDEFSKGKPISKIINESCFYGYNFYVNEHVLDPRPETEILVNSVVNDFANTTRELNILDICSGSGVILLTLLNEIKLSKGTGLDISKKAIDVSIINMRNMELQERCRFIESDLCEKIIPCKHQDRSSEPTEKYDIITSNPPYIKTSDIKHLDHTVLNYDPLIALDGGESGIEFYVKILDQSDALLKPNGKIYFEIGYDIMDDLENAIAKTPFKIEKTVKDLSNINRVLILNKKTF